MKSTILRLFMSLVLTGCVASPTELKEHNLLNVFESSQSYVLSSQIIKDMANYCDSGLFVVEHQNFVSLDKATIDLKNKNADYYFMHIEVVAKDNDTAIVSVYHYMNTSVTRTMAKTVEEWVTQGSQSCTQGF